MITFSSLKLENGLKKHVRNVARIKYGFFELVVILFTYYGSFIKKFTSLSHKIFENSTVTVKSKTLKNPWITRVILKSSKTKQRLI